MKTSKSRHQFYLSDALSKKLEQLAARPGASKTAIMGDALTSWFEREGAQEIDARFGPRLDRQHRTAARTERKLDALTELLGVFIQYQMTLTAHQPSFDTETSKLGRERYTQMFDYVERRLKAGGLAARLTATPAGEEPSDK